jgi:urease accessory protein
VDSGSWLRARALVETRADGVGVTRLHTLRGDGPLALRQAGGAVYLVGAAAGPLGGDELSLRCTVGTGSVLRLRSAAATLLLPDGGGARSHWELHAAVDVGAEFDCALEPLIVGRGCRHRQVSTVHLAVGACLRWREEIILGRHGEQPGECTLRLDVEYGDTPLLRHELHTGRWHTSPAVLGKAKAVGSLLLAGPQWASSMQPYADATLAVMPLAGPGVLIQAHASNAAELRRLLDHAEARLMYGSRTS